MRIIYKVNEEIRCKEIFSIESIENCLKIRVLTETIMSKEPRILHLQFVVDNLYNPKKLIQICFETGMFDLTECAILVNCE